VISPRIPPLHPLLYVVVLLLAVAQRGSAQQRFEYTEMHMALPVRIVLYAPDDSTARQAARAAFDRIASLESMMSDYRPQSELRRLQLRPDEWVTVSPELFDVLARALRLAELTHGAFDPTVGPLVALWREARRTGQLPGAEALHAARGGVGWKRVSLDVEARAVRLPAGTQLDLGGVAKGYILQEALQSLRTGGVDRAVIEAGGDIVAGDAPPGTGGWRIDVSDASPAFARQAASFANAALATSGPTAQFALIGGTRYSHVIDPRTGWALTHQHTARVISADATTADALATALTVLGDDERAAVLGNLPGVVVDLRSGTPGRQARSSRGR
jgi:FAD:protein FMN transferase